MCVRAAPEKERERGVMLEWGGAVLLRTVQAFSLGDKHVLSCQGRTRFKLSFSPTVLKEKHPLCCLAEKVINNRAVISMVCLLLSHKL